MCMVEWKWLEKVNLHPNQPTRTGNERKKNEQLDKKKYEKQQQQPGITEYKILYKEKKFQNNNNQ